jgi:large conductance mechanosensitive channel
MKKLDGFVDFVRSQGVVGMAVGIAIGLQAGIAVTAIVENFISPVVGFILGGTDLSELKWETGLERGGVELVIGWGAIANAIIVLLATAFVVYFVVDKAGLSKLDKKKD